MPQHRIRLYALPGPLFLGGKKIHVTVHDKVEMPYGGTMPGGEHVSTHIGDTPRQARVEFNITHRQQLKGEIVSLNRWGPDQEAWQRAES